MQWDEPVRSRDVAASRVPGTAGHVTLATAWTHAAAPPGRGAPSLMLWLDRPRAAVGEPVVLHLVTLGDAQCQGLGLLSGLQPVAGRIVVRAASAGRYQLAVRCVGAGGSVLRRRFGGAVEYLAVALDSGDELEVVVAPGAAHDGAHVMIRPTGVGAFAFAVEP